MKINKSCYVIYGLTTMPPWMVNAGFIVGDKKTLIVDCGGNYLSAKTIHGYATAVRPDNSLIALNTEPHSDHMGGNCFFREQGIDIYGHEGIDRNNDQLSAVKDYYNASVLDDFRQKHREGDLVYHKTSLVNPNLQFCEDFTIDLGGLEVQVIMTPGHTLENSSVYVPSLKTLYCGDMIVNGYVPNLTEGGIAEWKLWLQSLDKINKPELDIIISGHGEVISGLDINIEINRTIAVLEEAIKLGIAPTEVK